MNDADKNKVTPPADETKKGEAKPNPEPSQDDKSKNNDGKVKSKRSQKEKLIFTRNRIDEQLRELGEDDINDIGEEYDQPLTVGMLKKLRQEEAIKTSLELAEDIEDESEKEEVKHHIQHTIKSSGNPTKDFENAMALVNLAKAKQIAELATKNATATKKTFVSSGGAPAKTEDVFVPTAEESHFMKPPYNLSKEDILKARKAHEATQK